MFKKISSVLLLICMLVSLLSGVNTSFAYDNPPDVVDLTFQIDKASVSLGETVIFTGSHPNHKNEDIWISFQTFDEDGYPTYPNECWVEIIGHTSGTDSSFSIPFTIPNNFTPRTYGFELAFGDGQCYKPNTELTVNSVATVNKSILQSAIADATANKNATKVSSKGEDVDINELYVKSANRVTAYTISISTAQGVYDKVDATQAEVDQAIIDLQVATDLLNAAKHPGKITALQIDKTQVSKGESVTFTGKYNYFKNKTVWILFIYYDENGDQMFPVDSQGSFIQPEGNTDQEGNLLMNFMIPSNIDAITYSFEIKFQTETGATSRYPATQLAVNEAISKNIKLRVEGIYNTIIKASQEYSTLKNNAFDALNELLQANGIPMVASDGQYGKYISSINNETAAIFGGYDGWMYAVNNTEPSVSIDTYAINDGDDIVVYYGGFSPQTYLPQVTLSSTTVGKGETVELTLKATYFDWNTNSPVTVNISGATVKLENQMYTTNENGIATIIVPNEIGDYVLEICQNRENNYPLIVRTTSNIKVELTIKDIVRNAVDNASVAVLQNHYSIDWMAIGVARAGKTAPSTYLAEVEQYLKDPNNAEIFNRKPTEYERMTLGILAAGGHPTNIGGINLIEKIYSAQLQDQGFNAIVFGLIALDSGNYKTPTNALWDRDKLIQYILDMECTAGGWRFGGKGAIGDPDMTGMAMTALAPYKSKRTDVAQAIERAVSALSALQQQDGGYSSWGTANSESCAQAIMGLSVNGVDPTNAMFTKSGGNLIDALLRFVTPEGGFAHMKNTDGTYTINGMATEQALYCLDQYLYFRENKGSIYQWGDKTSFEIFNITTDTIQNGQNADFSVKVLNNTNSDKTVAIIIVLQDVTTSKIVKTESINRFMAQDTDTIFSSNFSIPTDGVYRFKSFVWENTTSIRPLSKTPVIVDVTQ